MTPKKVAKKKKVTKKPLREDIQNNAVATKVLESTIIGALRSYALLTGNCSIKFHLKVYEDHTFTTQMDIGRNPLRKPKK